MTHAQEQHELAVGELENRLDAEHELRTKAEDRVCELLTEIGHDRNLLIRVLSALRANAAHDVLANVVENRIGERRELFAEYLVSVVPVKALTKLKALRPDLHSWVWQPWIDEFIAACWP